MGSAARKFYRLSFVILLRPPNKISRSFRDGMGMREISPRKLGRSEPEGDERRTRIICDLKIDLFLLTTASRGPGRIAVTHINKGWR